MIQPSEHDSSMEELVGRAAGYLDLLEEGSVVSSGRRVCQPDPFPLFAAPLASNGNEGSPQRPPCTRFRSCTSCVAPISVSLLLIGVSASKTAETLQWTGPAIG